ncbi:HNH endonuclease [Chryseobacterium manosquense]|uniref:HNH endonuclease n=1 Tax=Chryseobacterium manosquense TaxID=2754694 RepID=A0A7H1DXF3_9FLAO|nr:HNH endonuclease signature motif containing protein [Chryseobacterium manosquense]QNS41661.1 HNH endonuclease [Chryseobacterium manosquense]
MFRDFTPKRQNITRKVSDYKNHRSDLKNDFKERCGYCNDIYVWRFASFEIDHFIPRKKDKKTFLTIKSETDYSNLVYACKSCNNSKSNKWPTNDENLHNENDIGFIDPCDDNYNLQFDRLNNGQIKAITPLGNWMFKELKLYKPQHEFIWNLEELDKIIEESEIILKSTTEETLSNDLKDIILDFYRKYRQYTKLLGNL